MVMCYIGYMMGICNAVCECYLDMMVYVMLLCVHVS